MPSFYIIVIGISLLASIAGLAAKENRAPPLLFFPFFLLLSVSVEYYGWARSMKNHNTTILYNFFTLFEFIFYLFFFSYLFKNSAIKKTIYFVIVFYFLITILNIFLFQGKKTFHTHTYILGCILVVTFAIGYFYFLFRYPETGSLTKNPYFWIATGLMFFYTCTFSLYGLENFIIKTIRQYDKFLFFVSDLLNVLLYTLFTIGFLCKNNFRKLLRL